MAPAAALAFKKSLRFIAERFFSFFMVKILFLNLSAPCAGWI
jgi:hypothetical protein